jgi:hypothetical protein
MAYPVPRRVEFTTADLLGLTALEWARVAVLAGVPQDRLSDLARSAVTHRASPEEIEAGTLVLYAAALQLERRLDRSLTWDDAQTWAVAFVTAEAEAKLVEAEADAEVQAAMISGVPIVDHAGELTVAHMAAYGRAHERARQAGAARRGRR